MLLCDYVVQLLICCQPKGNQPNREMTCRVKHKTAARMYKPIRILVCEYVCVYACMCVEIWSCIVRLYELRIKVFWQNSSKKKDGKKPETKMK